MNILITGGNRGLGFELAKIFSESGHNVMTIIRNKSVEQELKRKIPACKVMIADVTKTDQLLRLEQVLDLKLDVLINNAGSGSAGISIEDSDSTEVDNQFQVHCMGAFNVTQVFFSSLLKSESPLIINISSRLGSMSRNAKGEFSAKKFSYGYRIAKAAQNMLTQCLSQELGPKGFKVCALHPGRLKTSSGAADAYMSAIESAGKIYDLVVSNKIENGIYYCIESGTMEW